MSEAVTDQEVLEALRSVNDPELGINIVDLGMIYGIETNKTAVRIVMTMTTPACPMSDFLTGEVESVILSRFADVDSVGVELVWDPPWNPAMMSDAAKQQLGWSG